MGCCCSKPPKITQRGIKPDVVLPSDRNFNPSINGTNQWTVQEVYDDTGEELGRGEFNIITKATHKLHEVRCRKKSNPAPWSVVAIKKTRPSRFDNEQEGRRLVTHLDVADACQEVRTLVRLQQGHTYKDANSMPVLFLYEYFWENNTTTPDGQFLYLVTEVFGQRLDKWRIENTHLKESTVKKVAKRLLDAIEFMHSRDVVHRDLTMRNILFRENGNVDTIKVVDFGLAKDLSTAPDGVKDFCGSFGYIAPEIYQPEIYEQEAPYKYEVDMFAFGVIVFRLLSGSRPFPSENPGMVRADTINLHYVVEALRWRDVSVNATQLVRQLLIGRQERLRVEEAKEHDWLASNEIDSDLQVDFTVSDGYVAPQTDNHSKACEPVEWDDGPFWLDLPVERAVRRLLELELYNGRILSQDDDGICLEEVPFPNTSGLFEYLGGLQSYTEKECRDNFRKILKLVRLMHDEGLAFRKLTPDTFRVKHDESLLISGLRYAQAIQQHQPLTGHFGYLYSWYAFTAPEIDRDFTHLPAVDLWSLGLMLYMMSTGIPPFRGSGADLTASKHKGDVDFDVVMVSPSLQELVKGLLRVDPEERMIIAGVLDCKWMNESDETLTGYDLEIAQVSFQDWKMQ